MVPTLSTAQFADPAEATKRLLNKFVNDEAIPVINMLNPEQNKYAEAICDAAEKWGFFQVINYGVDLDVLDNVKAATHRFFNLPFEEMSRLTKENSLSTNVRFGMSFSPRAEKDYLSLFFVSESEQFLSEDYDSGDGEEEEEEEIFGLEQEPMPSELSSPRGGEETKESEVVKIPEESILKRINSKKESRHFQLGKQISCKWTTGPGPRIGCVRYYLSELQFQALEQVNSSLRSASVSRLCFSSLSSTQTPQMSPLWRGVSLPADCSHIIITLS
ncbi:unnamed protein product [Brassica oleracea]